MRLVTLATLAAAGLLSALPLAPGAWAQPAPAAPTGPAEQATNPTAGAEEVVGLFGATCVHYAGNAAALRAWLAQQQAPQMPGELRTFFLAGRQGQVYDVSSQTARLALVSADDGSCSAYADVADPSLVVRDLESAMRQANMNFTPQGDRADPRDPSLHHRNYTVTINGRPWLVLVTTTAAAGPGKPQAALTLHPAG